MVAGNARSAFLMTEPAAEGGAGSDPSMLQTVAVQQGGEWVISGRKAFATGFAGAKIAIIMARTDDGSGGIAATMFLVDLPDPAIRIDRIPHTIDSLMRSEEHTSELQSLMRISYAVFCLNKKKPTHEHNAD